MFRKMLKSKIHRASVTDANLNYQGSVTIDSELMTLADLKPFEFVDIWDVNNGSRFETYVIEGAKGTREICINGAAARLVEPGDKVIIASSIYLDSDNIDFSPSIVFVDELNNPVSKS